ncbi:DNA-binding protein [Methylobacterium sp. WL19]|uniref:helix-turn-helix transcriptional regulator n=1 Tax=Methylobacterium sp. WL19 TaxID=2603896 RepID=UPI001AEEFA2C|nr:DNA-binding protein [Methylobacterium sp. WL19]
MPLPIQKTPDELLPATPTRMRYGVSDMTLWRWENDPALGFPKPIRINGRRYWRIADLQAFEARQASKREAA